MTFFAPLPHRGIEEEGLAATATLQVYLDQQDAPETTMGVDFLATAGRFLELTGVQSIYDIWLDHSVVYRVPKENEDKDNHEEALSKAISSISSSKVHPREVGVWAHGISGDFYLEFRLRFRRMQDADEPGLILEVGGNPGELTDPTGKNQFELDDRLTELESDKGEIEGQNSRIRTAFTAKLQEVQAILKRLFKVKEIRQDVKVDVESIW